MKQITNFSLFISFLLLLASCQSGSNRKSTEGTEVKFQYARLVKMTEYEGFQTVEVKNPWDTTRILHSYLLVDKTKPIPAGLPDGTVIRTPLEKSAVFTTVHSSLFEELGVVNAIAGVCDMEYIIDATVVGLCKSGKIVDLGSSMGPDIEKMIDLSPDAIFLSPFKNSGGHGELDKLGAPIFECADYMENHPLGRAEWVRVYGRLFGEETKADSIFAQVMATYNQIENQSKQDTSVKPSLLYGLDNGGTWYVPGGNSYMAKMFASAGANYIFRDNNHVGSEPLAFETVFDKGFDADVWLFLYNEENDKTYKDLEKFSDFKSVKDRHVFACNTGKIRYYEEIPFHPERLLKDLHVIFHSGNVENLHYYSKLAE